VAASLLAYVKVDELVKKRLLQIADSNPRIGGH